MSIERKHAYRFVFLKSEKWGMLRLKTLVAFQGKCYVCGEESHSNDAHHLRYPKNIWETRQHHLVPLCRRCHMIIHSIEKDLNFEQTSNFHWKKFLFLVAKAKEVLKIPLDKRDAKYINRVQTSVKSRRVE